MRNKIIILSDGGNSLFKSLHYMFDSVVLFLIPIHLGESKSLGVKLDTKEKASLCTYIEVYVFIKIMKTH
jgi:hypothetical protein